jgi:hypothetical protein
MFHWLLGITLLLGGATLTCASYSEGALVSFRSAAELTGWLCVSAIVLTLCTLPARSGGLRRILPPSLAQFTAGATTLLTGSLLLYVTYFEWSELPVPLVPSAASAAATDQALAASPKLFPTGTVVVAPLPPAQPALTTSLAAAAGSTSRERSPARRAADDYVDDPCSSLSGIASLQCQRCATGGWFSRLLCDERARLEYCADQQGAHPGCPSAIPASAPQ